MQGVGLPVELEIFFNWRAGLGLPSEDGTWYGLDTELAQILLRLQNELAMKGLL